MVLLEEALDRDSPFATLSFTEAIYSAFREAPRKRPRLKHSIGGADSAHRPTATTPTPVSGNAQRAEVAPRYDALQTEKISLESIRQLGLPLGKRFTPSISLTWNIGMPGNLRANRRRRNSRSNPRNTQNVEKARGVIGPRVKQVGGEKLAIVCVDPTPPRATVVAGRRSKIVGFPAQTPRRWVSAATPCDKSDIVVPQTKIQEKDAFTPILRTNPVSFLRGGHRAAV